ncbi:MAG: hypothetical protein ACE5IY_13195 [bacterium]
MHAKNSAGIVSLAFVLLLGLCHRSANAQEDYEKWLEKQQQAFQEFKEKRDKDFTEFLKKEWRNMQLREGLKRDENPKPVKMPQAEKLPPRDIDRPDLRIIKDIPVPEVVPLPIPELEDNPVPLDLEKGQPITVDYFGAALTVHVDRGFSSPFVAHIENKALSAHWKKLSALNYEDLLTQVQFLREQMQLNDWGYGMLLNGVARGIHPTSQNDRNLFLWFMLSKSGYEAKIGYQKNRIYLLLPSLNVLYGVRYFVIDGRKFHVLSFDNQNEKVKSLFTYDGRYPGAITSFDLEVKNVPKIKNAGTSKHLSFEYRGKTYALAVDYDDSAVKFFEYYPQTNLEVYFGAPVSSVAARSLLTGLKSIVEGKSETEAVNILLRFVQTAFDYRTDGEQFGREKYLFAEETLFYPYSDCEDRSILFAYLVNRLLGLEVIGLDYPGHVATAVHFTSRVEGDHLLYENKRFVICDPTYINAAFGMTMPVVKHATPEVIALSFRTARASK